MQRPSSLLIIVSLAFTSAAVAGTPGAQRQRPGRIPPPTRAELLRSIRASTVHGEARQKVYFRTGIMKRAMEQGRQVRAELVADSPLAEVREVPAPRGKEAKHAAYRVTYLRGRVLHAQLLVPQKSGEVLVRPVALRMKPGTRVLDLGGGRRIYIHWDGTSRQE
jgi:hypothetical protein